MEQLRRKYASVDSSSALVPASPDKLSDKSLDYGLDVVPCPVCQGMGLQQETYNYRILEKCCTHCDGQGVMVYKDGVLVKEDTEHDTVKNDKPVWAQTVRCGERHSPGTVVRTCERASGILGCRERVERLESQVLCIDGKLEKYQQVDTGLTACPLTRQPSIALLTNIALAPAACAAHHPLNSHCCNRAPLTNAVVF
jgi:hypothetical protein